MKRLLLTAATLALLNGAAYAGDPSDLVIRGTAGAYLLTAQGVPIIMPWVSDRTAKQSRIKRTRKYD